MSKVVFNSSVSQDGFVAGLHDEVGEVFHPCESGDTDVPLPGTDLVFRVSRRSAEYLRATWPRYGAAIWGRRTFDITKGWGGRPPGGYPCSVLTHSVPERWVYEGPPFTFVTDGTESAVAQAKAAAGDKHVAVSTGATMRACLAAELLDELHLDLAPVLLRFCSGRGFGCSGGRRRGSSIFLRSEPRA